MPNYVRNVMKIDAGSPEEAKKRVSALSGVDPWGEKKDFTFNNFIPMPDSIRDCDETSYNEGYLYAYFSKKDSVAMDKVVEEFKKIDYKPFFGTVEEAARDAQKLYHNFKGDDLSTAYQKGKTLVENKEKYGVMTNYRWAIENWDTKWDAGEASIDTDKNGLVTVSFDTAWSCPKAVLAAISKKFPDKTVDCLYADEDFGSNCGHIEASFEDDGVVVESEEFGNTEHGFAFALDLWQQPIDEYLYEQGRTFRSLCKAFGFNEKALREELKKFDNEPSKKSKAIDKE